MFFSNEPLKIKEIDFIDVLEIMRKDFPIPSPGGLVSNVYASASEIKNALPNGKTVTLVGGCFDLLHVGHIHLFEYAASLEDLLVVAILSDSYIKTYKNASRPVIPEDQRAKMVASMRFADFVWITDVSPSSPEVLKILRPDSVVFGQEPGQEEKIAARKRTLELISPRTRIKLLPRYMDGEVSTGQIIRKVRALHDLPLAG